MNRILLRLLPVLASASAIASPPADDPPPVPPCVAQAPAWCAWTETYTRSPHARAGIDYESPLMPKVIQVVKAGDLRRDVVTGGDGIARERWIAGGVEMYPHPRSPATTMFCDARTDLGARTYRGADFALLDWVGPDRYVGTAACEGRKCRHYAAPPLPLPAAPAAQDYIAALPREAWIDFVTGLPVAFDDGETRRVYQFSGERPGPLVLPGRFAVELRRYRAAADAPALNAAIR